jgi:cytochrome c oxidase assembly factor CtaG
MSQQKPSWWTVYKLFIILFSIASMLMMCFYTIPGIILFVFSLLLWGTQHRREKDWQAEQRRQHDNWIAHQRHQQQMQAMYNQGHPPSSIPPPPPPR